jgi:hypothetical protein
MKFKRWQESTLSNIAGQIASDNGMALDYQGTDQKIASIEQYDESDFCVPIPSRRRAEKRHSLPISLPFCLKIESGDVWKISGVGPDWDGSWLAIEVEQAIADSGSTTRASYEKCLNW